MAAVDMFSSREEIWTEVCRLSEENALLRGQLEDFRNDVSQLLRDCSARVAEAMDNFDIALEKIGRPVGTQKAA